MAFLYIKALLMFVKSNFNMKPYILLSLLFLMAESYNFPPEEGPIDYYINLIRTSINKISQYELPTNAHMHKPQDNVIHDYGTYDFIIVGSGLSGSVLANRLSEIDKWRVLLIEAGNFTDGGLLKIPGFPSYHKNSTYNWGYKSVPQKNFCLDNPNQQCSLDRGKGVGGGSLINAMVYCRGPAENYNSLAQLVNDSSWNYQNMMPYFKKTESFRRTNPNALVDMRYHGQYGLLQVQHGTPDIDYTQPFFDANKELGYKIVDYNGPSMLGASHLQHTLRYGNREDFGSIFISPFFGRQSLDVTTGSYVIKVEINNGTKNAESVLFTKGGTTYRAKASKEIILSSDYGSFDFVIVGAGVSGSVIANRLSEIADWKVLLIEAGDYTDGGFIQIPGFLRHHKYSKYNWEYPSVSQKNICLGNANHKCDISRGKGVGGGSLINELVYCRGPPEQYDQLAINVNDSSWSFENLLPYFKKFEHFDWKNAKAPIELSYHGQAGLLHNEHGLPDSVFNQPFFEANEEMGYKVIDYNGPNMIGPSYVQRFIKNGLREDFGSVFVTPFLGRASLKVTQNSYVTKIEINNVTKTAESVLFVKNGQTYRARAEKEVILSAGSIASPQILMLSGIGLQDHLSDLGIPIIENLAVGNNYQDTVIVALPFMSLFKHHQPSLREQLKEYFNGTGALSYPPSLPQLIGFYQLNKTQTSIPDLEFFTLVSQDLKALLQDQSKNSNATVMILGAEYFPTKSIGKIRLNSNNPYDYPLIDPNGFSDENNEDLEGLYQCVEFIFKLVNSKPYKKYQFRNLNVPVPACSDIQGKGREYWHCVLKQNALPGLHMVGTCAMGSDPRKGAVVDSSLKVFGLKNLRVADCSVYPHNIAGHSTIPCATIGEKISDVIKRDYGKTVYEN